MYEASSGSTPRWYLNRPSVELAWEFGEPAASSAAKGQRAAGGRAFFEGSSAVVPTLRSEYGYPDGLFEALAFFEEQLAD